MLSLPDTSRWLFSYFCSGLCGTRLPRRWKKSEVTTARVRDHSHPALKPTLALGEQLTFCQEIVIFIILLQTSGLLDQWDPWDPAGDLRRQRQLAEEKTRRGRGHEGGGGICSPCLCWTFALFPIPGQCGGGVQEGADPVHQLLPAASQCLGWQVGEWTGGGLILKTTICPKWSNVFYHQVKQEKAGQEQVSTSPYPASFPEALAFPNYEAAMNQYTSVSPTQGWLRI